MSFIRRHWLEISVTLFALAIYAAFSGSMLLRQSGAPQFIFQADAFLHGRLWVEDPPNLNDWVRWNDHWYVSFPPFPAVLMMPFVAINGLAFNNVFFTVCLSALNVGLFACLLKSWRRAGRHVRPDWQLALLTAFFAFGTVYFYSSIRGEVWFTAHVVGVTLTLIYLWAGLDARRPIIAGLALGCAAITRANLAFAFPFFLIECSFPDGRPPVKRPFPDWLRRMALFGAAAAVAVLPALWANHARWDNWTEFGHSMLYHNRVTAIAQRYGLFNARFFDANFHSAFLLLPTVTTDPFHVGFNGHGMSMLVTTPLLLAIPFALRRQRTVVALAITAVVTALPGLFYMNDGWYQFGYRFSIDYLPFLFFILTLSRFRAGAVAIVLGVAGVAVNTWGALVFGR